MSQASRTRVTLLLAITFLAGMAAGVAADQQLQSTPSVEPAKQTREFQRSDRRGRGTTIERFADELGLTAEQRAQIDPILDDMSERMSELFKPVRPAYRALVDSSRARIEAILTPEQVAEYRLLLERDYGRAPEKRGRDEHNDREPGE